MKKDKEKESEELKLKWKEGLFSQSKTIITMEIKYGFLTHIRRDPREDTDYVN